MGRNDKFSTRQKVKNRAKSGLERTTLRGALSRGFEDVGGPRVEATVPRGFLGTARAVARSARGLAIRAGKRSARETREIRSMMESAEGEAAGIEAFTPRSLSHSDAVESMKSIGKAMADLSRGFSKTASKSRRSGA